MIDSHWAILAATKQLYAGVITIDNVMSMHKVKVKSQGQGYKGQNISCNLGISGL